MALDELTLLNLILEQTKILNLDPEYWELIPIDVDKPVVLPAGAERDLLFERERGKLIAMTFVVDNPLVKLTIYLDDRKIEGTPTDLYVAGLVGYNPTTFWLSRYDVANNAYVIWYTPVPPMDYFAQVKMTAKAPALVDVNYSYSIYRWKMKKEPVKVLRK